MGSRVGPPTRMTASTSAAVRRADWRASSQTLKVRCTRSITILLNWSALEPLRQVEHLPLGRLADGGDAGSRPRPSRPTSILARSAGLLEHLQAELVLAQVQAVLLQEVLGQPGHDAVVEVVAAQVGVAGGGEHLEDVLADLQDGDVEGAAAQVVDADLLVDVLAEAVGQRRRGRLVDDAQHLEPGDPAGVLGGLALVVVEVGRAGDDGLLDLAAEVRLGDGLHLLEHQGRDLGHRHDLVAHLEAHRVVGPLDDAVGHHRLGLLHLVGEVEAADEPLGRVDGVLGVGDDVLLGVVADQDVAVLEEAHHRGVGALAPLVGDDLGRPARRATATQE